MYVRTRCTRVRNITSITRLFSLVARAFNFYSNISSLSLKFKPERPFCFSHTSNRIYLPYWPLLLTRPQHDLLYHVMSPACACTSIEHGNSSQPFPRSSLSPKGKGYEYSSLERTRLRRIFSFKYCRN